MNKLQELFINLFANGTEGTEEKPIKLVFSGKRRKSTEYSKITIRPVLIGGQISYQAEYSYEKKQFIRTFLQKKLLIFA